MADAIRIEGLAEFSRSLKAMDSELPKALRVALNVAADAVVDRATPSIPTRTGRARRSVKARSTRTMARVVGGGPKAPYYPWLDFGGKVGPGRRIERPFFKHGRYIYAAYFGLKERGEFGDILQRELVAVAQRAGLEVT